MWIAFVEGGGEEDDKTRSWNVQASPPLSLEEEVEVKEEVEVEKEVDVDKTRSRSWNVQAPPPRSLS